MRRPLLAVVTSPDDTPGLTVRGCDTLSGGLTVRSVLPLGSAIVGLILPPAALALEALAGGFAAAGVAAGVAGGWVDGACAAADAPGAFADDAAGNCVLSLMTRSLLRKATATGSYERQKR